MEKFLHEIGCLCDSYYVNPIHERCSLLLLNRHQSLVSGIAQTQTSYVKQYHTDEIFMFISLKKTSVRGTSESRFRARVNISESSSLYLSIPI